MLTTILCILLLVIAVFLTIAVLMQHGKSHNLSGTIAGGAETFFGKTKGRSVDAMLSKITTIVSIIFVILVIVVYVIQDDTQLPVTQQQTQQGETQTPTDDTQANPTDDGVTTDDTQTPEDGAAEPQTTPADGNEQGGQDTTASADDIQTPVAPTDTNEPAADTQAQPAA